MKRWIAAALCIGLILSQTGCGQPEQQETNPSTTAETSPTETQASTTPSPEPGTVPESEEVTSPSEMIETLPAEETTPVSQTDSLVAVTLAPVLEEEKDADGASIFQHQYQNITLTIPDAPEAAQKMKLQTLQQKFGSGPSRPIPAKGKAGPPIPVKLFLHQSAWILLLLAFPASAGSTPAEFTPIGFCFL